MVGFDAYQHVELSGLGRRGQHEVLIQLLRALDDLLQPARNPKAIIGLLRDIYADRESISASSRRRRIHRTTAQRMILRVALMLQVKSDKKQAGKPFPEHRRD